MKGFSEEELAIVYAIRDIVGEQVDEYECFEVWEEIFMMI